MKKNFTFGKFRKVAQLLFFLITTFSLFRYDKAFFPTLFIVGAVFCGWACAFGTFQEWSFKLGQKTFKKKIEVPKNLHMVLSKICYLILILGTISITSSFVRPFDAHKGFFHLLFRKEIGITLLIITVSFMILSLFIERAFCNYYCPKGAWLGIVGLLRPFTIIRNEDTCIDCKLCDKACPMKIDVSTTKRLVNPACISCYDCIDVCPKKGALKLGFKSKKK